MNHLEVMNCVVFLQSVIFLGAFRYGRYGLNDALVMRRQNSVGILAYWVRICGNFLSKILNLVKKLRPRTFQISIKEFDLLPEN